MNDPILPQELTHETGPIEQRDQFVARLSAQIQRWGLATPVALLLEAHRPLGYLAGQALWLIQPMLSWLFDSQSLAEYASLLEDQEALNALLNSLAPDSLPLGCCRPNSTAENAESAEKTK